MTNLSAVFSDLHLGIHCNSPEWLAVAEDCVEQMANDLERLSVSKVFFLGDFFHDNGEAVDATVLEAGRRIIKRLKDTRVFLVEGNHCQRIKRRVKGRCPLSEISKGVGHVSVVGQPLTVRDQSLSILLSPWGVPEDRLGRSDVFMTHAALNSFEHAPGKVCLSGKSPESFVRISPLIFSGHFHARNEGRIEGGTIVYVGSPYEMYPDDLGARKGYYLLETPTLKYEFVHIPQSRYFTRGMMPAVKIAG
jgi:DNA repair exonuclease SbcCD nuclease subunit